MLTMGQLSNVLLAIKHTVPKRALDCGPGLGGLKQVMGPTIPFPLFRVSICGRYINIFTRCTNRNQYDILMTAAADVSKGQTDISYKGEESTWEPQLECTCSHMHIKSEWSVYFVNLRNK